MERQATMDILRLCRGAARDRPYKAEGSWLDRTRAFHLFVKQRFEHEKKPAEAG